jgi:DNA-3-methyladenine glycosylase
VRKLPRSFYDRDTVEVAQELLGMHLVHVVSGVERVGRIVEVEAYLGPHDLAAHSARGLTPRTRVMFGPPGHAYVYFIYGMHWCANVVTQAEGTASAVLLRGVGAGEERRGPLPNGPALLCKAMGLDGRHHGHDLLSDDLYIRRPGRGNAAAARAQFPRNRSPSSAAHASASTMPAATGPAGCCASTSAPTRSSRENKWGQSRIRNSTLTPFILQVYNRPMTRVLSLLAGLVLAACAHMHTPCTHASGGLAGAARRVRALGHARRRCQLRQHRDRAEGPGGRRSARGGT